MSTILIKNNSENNELIAQLAIKLGGNVINIDDEAIEEFMLGKIMDNEKTKETVDKESILNILNSK